MTTAVVAVAVTALTSCERGTGGKYRPADVRAIPMQPLRKNDAVVVSTILQPTVLGRWIA